MEPVRDGNFFCESLTLNVILVTIVIYLLIDAVEV